MTPAAVSERPGVRVHRLRPSDPELLDLQQQADLLCLPTYGDAAPWAVLEAMACGTPVLATRVGGIPDMLEEGRAGALVPARRRGGAGEALRALLGSPTLRAELAARARERCERAYDARLQFAELARLLGALQVLFRNRGYPGPCSRRRLPTGDRCWLPLLRRAPSRAPARAACACCSSTRATSARMCSATDQLDAALRPGLASAPEVEARFVGLTPDAAPGQRCRHAPDRTAPQGRASTCTALRWHLVQSLRARARARARARGAGRPTSCTSTRQRSPWRWPP